MMKKWIRAAGGALAVSVLLCLPASALTVLTGDGFTKTPSAQWETDRYAPHNFVCVDGHLELSVGKNGFRAYRPAGMQDDFYALQGKKIAVTKPTKNTWSAVVKVNLDDGQWLVSASGKRRFEFRVDLVNANGDVIKDSPTIAITKSGTEMPKLQFYNPRAKDSWGVAETFINRDKESEEIQLEPQWYTLIIKSVDGTIMYYLNGMKLGNCTVGTTDAYPSHMALAMTNFNRADTVQLDNCYLYDGSYSMALPLTEEQQEERDESLAEKYESKRESWYERHTEYRVLINGQWVWKKGTSLTKSQKENATSTRIEDEMPESYWDY